MNAIWIPALIAVAIASLAIGLYVGLGRRTPAVAGPVVAPIRLFPFWKTWWFATAIILIALAIAGVYLLPVLAGVKMPEVHLPALKWYTPFWLFVAAALIILSFFLTKNLQKIAFALGLLVLLITLALSGLGVGFAKWETHVENCVAYSDCGLRSDDLPIINGGIVYIPPGEFKSFYAVGEVAIQNQIGYCLDVSPRGTFKLRETSDARIVYIRAWSGMKELATVTSLPASECTK